MLLASVSILFLNVSTQMVTVMWLSKNSIDAFVTTAH
jgi:hypothetical protein